MNAAYATPCTNCHARQRNSCAAQRAAGVREARGKGARRALRKTRQGTMYVPMQAADATNVIRDRALLWKAMCG